MDQLTEFFRGRFAGHEMDVPEGAWEHISGQLAAGGGEGLRETLQEKFRGHEADVDPSAWGHISKQLGHATEGVGTARWIAAGVAAVAITAGIFLWNSGPEQAVPALTEQAKVELAEIPAAPTEVEQAGTTPEADVTVPATTEVAKPQRTPEAGTPALVDGQETGMGGAAVEQETNRGTGDVEVTVGGTMAVPTPMTPVQPTIRTSEQQREAAPATPVVAQEEKENQPGTREGGEKPQAKQPMVPAGTGSNETATEEPNTDAFGTVPDDKIFIPDAFTPQGDDVNDLLGVQATGYESVDLRVFYTKNGALVFQTNDLDKQWDGRLPNGNNAEDGHYMCIVRVNYPDGRSVVKKEVVRLMR